MTMNYHKKTRPAPWTRMFRKHTRKIPMVRKRIRPVSKSMAGKKRIYRKLRAEFLRERPWCECCLVRNRTPRAISTDVHHMKGRVGDLLLDQRFWLSVCRECHDHIHSNVSWSYQNGVLLHRNKFEAPGETACKTAFVGEQLEFAPRTRPEPLQPSQNV